MSSAMSPVRACPGCSSWQVSVIKQLQFQQFVGQWRGALQFLDRLVGIAVMQTETGTHSFTLCIMDWIDVPVVVHVKVVDISVVAQTQIPHGPFYQRFYSYSTLTR